MDPAEVRRRNFIPKDAFPHTTRHRRDRTTRATTRARSTSRCASAGYDELRAEQKRRRDAGRRAQLGIGLSLLRRDHERHRRGASSARSRSRADGGAILRTGSFSHGQGHETTFAMIVAERLGLPDREGRRSSRATPTRSPRGTGTYGSKSTQIGGAAAARPRPRRSSSRRSSSSPTSSRRARGHRPRHGARPLPRRRRRRRRRSRGPSWRRARRATAGSAS